MRLKDLTPDERRLFEQERLWFDRVLRVMFDDTGNGLFALDALTRARQRNEAPPEWVLEYLARASDAVRADGAPPADAFQLQAKGASSALSEYRRFYRDLNIVLNDMSDQLAKGLALKPAAEEAAAVQAAALAKGAQRDPKRFAGVAPRDPKFFERAFRRLDPILRAAEGDKT